MSILNAFFGWDHKVRKLRKKWDRAREKTLKKKNPLKLQILKKLDAINLTLTTIEEQHLSRPERSRMSKEVEINLAEVKGLLELKEDEIEAMNARQRQQNSK